MSKDRLIFKPTDDNNVLEKDGKRYRLLKEKVVDGHIIECVFEEFDGQEIDAKIKRISGYLVAHSGLTAKMIIEDLLKEIDTKTLEKIVKQIEKEEPVKVWRGCMSLKLGKRTIEIR